MEDCLFCKMIAGAIPAEKVYEDEKSFAFLDINPVNHGHTLVIPKTHARNLLETDDKALEHLITVVKKLGSVIKNAMEADGINVHFNNEPAAGQAVFHTHAHIIPRFADDGIQMWPQSPYEEGEAEAVAKRIRDALA